MDRTLNDRMEFDHVIEVTAAGDVIDRPDLHAPDLYDDELADPDWVLLDGYSGQHGYSGPMMHASEFIGGHMERDMLADPGVYVALANYSLAEGEPTDEWAVARWTGG